MIRQSNALLSACELLECAGWPGMMLAGLGRACRAGFRPVRGSAAGPIAVCGWWRRCEPGADDQRAVGLATGARKQRAGLGAQVRGRPGGAGQGEREPVPGEAVTPGERQAMGRRAVQDFEAGAWLGAEQSGDGASFRDAQGRGGVALQRSTPVRAARQS